MPNVKKIRGLNLLGHLGLLRDDLDLYKNIQRRWLMIREKHVNS
jgi:hypothetical protein